MIFTIVKQLWQKNLVLKCLILICLPLLIITLWSGLPIVVAKVCAYLLFVLGFSCFDSYGFALTQERDTDLSELRITYRVIQDLFEFIALWGIYQYVGIWPVVGCLVAHWFTTCDKLFYILRKEPDYLGEYTWLEGWSIFLILKHIGIKPTTTAIFNLWAFIGFVGGLALSLHDFLLTYLFH